ELPELRNRGLRRVRHRARLGLPRHTSADPPPAAHCAAACRTRHHAPRHRRTQTM
ncbi:MAG: hypothetical protein AVDCRST_MAG71-1456, partial [uncultured Lysobacter sp.]